MGGREIGGSHEGGLVLEGEAGVGTGIGKRYLREEMVPISLLVRMVIILKPEFGVG